MPETVGRDKDGRAIHKGELVEYVYSSHIRIGYLQGSIVEGDLLMYEIRDRKTNKINYVFEREVLREISGRLKPATQKFTSDLIKSLAI